VSEARDRIDGDLGADGEEAVVLRAHHVLVKRLFALLLALVLAAVAGWLGVWQLDAWQTRREAEALDLTSLEPRALADVIGPDDAFPGADVGRPVEVTGSWLPEGTVHVSGRVQGGREGYWAVTPLAVGGADQPAILVVRGWSPTPDTEPPTGTATVTGWLQPPEGSGAVDPDPGDDVLPELRVADAIQRVDQDLYGAYVVLDPARTDTARSDTASLEPASLAALPDVGRFTALRNLLYALEWWFFGAFAVFVWWRWDRDTREAAEAGAGTQPAAG
jgi:cytochrome oxidase assembly protein ShyY1